jgi:hypothetical protein
VVRVEKQQRSVAPHQLLHRMSRGRVLILWNQLDDDVVELWRRDDRKAPDWDPSLEVERWDTVA